MYEPRKVKLVDVPEQSLEGEGEILFQPELACLCGSDLLYFEGDYHEHMPVIGQSLHEMIGRVVETTGSKFNVGDRVLCVPTEHFGFYERFRVTEKQAIPLDARPPEDQALLAQPLGTVLFGLKKVPSVLDKDVVVLGQGPIGQLFNGALRNLGARKIIGVDLLGDRLDVSSKMGANATISADREDIVEAVRELTDGAMADLVVEAVGHREQRINDCFNLVRYGGDILFFGVPRAKMDDVHWRIFFDKNASIHTSIGPSFERDFPLAMQWIAEKRIDVTPCITHQMPLDQIQEAFDIFAERRDGAIKVFVDFPR
ncbi:MAG: zinc-binding dehydrogenase [Planctomycetes bacterium]|nr:zinc-binding dehydrogenase [Planctomycetota bacterium]